MGHGLANLSLQHLIVHVSYSVNGQRYEETLRRFQHLKSLHLVFARCKSPGRADLVVDLSSSHSLLNVRMCGMGISDRLSFLPQSDFVRDVEISHSIVSDLSFLLPLRNGIGALRLADVTGIGPCTRMAFPALRKLECIRVSERLLAGLSGPAHDECRPQLTADIPLRRCGV